MKVSAGSGGRVALITGAGRGIGRGIAERLAADGVAVVVNDRDADVCEQAAADLRTAGGRAVAAPGDVTDPGHTDRVVRAAREAFGGLDIVVNNAGITRDGSIGRMTDEDWRVVQEVVLYGAFCVCRSALPALRESHAERGTHGKLINMSSSVGIYGAPGTVNYSSAKAGLIGLTKTLAREWARYRINVNALAPGLIAGTQLTDGKPPELIAAVAEKVPLGRAGTPEDVAGAVAFLASVDSDYMTGQVLELHGGLEVLG